MTYKHTYDDVKSYRHCIQQMREHLEKSDLSDRDANSTHDSIERYEKWIREAGYQIDYRPGEEPIGAVSASEPEESPAETPNYEAYFRLDDGTTDCWDFYAGNWIEANRQAWQILNREYREWVRVEPRTVVRNEETFVHYTHGKKPVGKRFARLIGLKDISIESEGAR